MSASANFKATSFSQWRAIAQAFQESRSSIFWVLKELTRTFGLIWLPLAAAVLFTIHFTLPGFPTWMVKISLTGFENCFTIFLVPYFTYKFIQTHQGGTIETFKVFLTETIVPLIIASIKAAFIILGYLLLLIVPGIIKTLRLSLLNYTVFFDPRVRENRVSAIKAAQETTRGVLLSICFAHIGFGLIGLVLSKVLSVILTLGVAKENLFLNSMADSLIYFFEFYWHSFKYIFMTHFFFILQKRK